MYQTIALSPTVLQELSSMNFDQRTKVLYNLITEEILSDADSIILNEYLECIDKLAGRQKMIMEALLPDLIQRVRRQKDIFVQKRTIDEYSNYETEIKLAENSLWQIIISNKVDKCKKEKLIHNYNIEISDLKNYLKPSYLSRIRSIETIELKPGENFNFRNWIEKYVRDAQTIRIEDGYMCGKYEYEDLYHILSTIDPDIKVEIITFDDNMRNKSRHNNRNDGIKVKEKLEQLIDTLKLTKTNYLLIKNKKDLKDRCIKTDKFIINHGHALGAVNANNNVVIHQCTIGVQTIF